LSLAQWNLWELLSEKVARDIRRDLVDAWIKLSPVKRRQDQKLQNAESNLTATLTNDVRLYREYVVHFHGGLPREGLQVLLLGTSLWMLSPKLMTLFVLAIAPAGIGLSHIGKKIRKRAGQALGNFSELAEWLQQRFLGIETIKHYRTESIEIKKLEALNSNLIERFLRAARVKARTSPMLEVFAGFALLLVLWVALSDVAAGSISGSVLLSFFATLGLLSQALTKLGRYLNSNREGSAAAERINTTHTLMTENSSHQVGIEIKKNGPLLGIFDLDVTWPGRSTPALRALSHEFFAGRVTCILGSSGAGKSTLLRAILGLVSPQNGHITTQSPDVITWMPQTPLLAPDTLAANIAWPDPNIDSEKVARAAHEAGLDTVIRELPSGLQTLIGAGGQGLSGGQGQRVQLARLFYHASPLILVDEGTSALDPETEADVLNGIRRLAEKGRCVIMVAHRLAATRIADEIMILEDGELKLVGPADQVKKDPLFQKISGTSSQTAQDTI
jgi:ABC-type multidrug transport system fused ATPase/permease subunit